jgi:hypothetical protein
VEITRSESVREREGERKEKDERAKNEELFKGGQIA